MKTDSLTILGIETSCDETAAAVVVDGRKVLSDIVSSQIDTHRLYGGVVPEIASRLHIECISGVTRLALKEAGVTLSDIDIVAVTKGPGLVGALLIGVSFAKALCFALQKPLVGVHHLKGHIAANYISHPFLTPPYVSLVVSGGHTDLMVVEDYTSVRLIGSTRDDAAGECFDKVARAMGLPYPGGPALDRLAMGGDPHAVELPGGGVSGHPYDFSFSGLKSSVLNYINTSRMRGEEVNAADLAASFEEAVCHSLVPRAVRLAKEEGLGVIALSGGVSANTLLRERLSEAGLAEGIRVLCPETCYCTDNAAMIAAQGYYEFLSGVRDDESLDAYPDLGLREGEHG